MPSNGDEEFGLHISQNKVNRWLRETMPACSGNDFPPDFRSEEPVRNTTQSPARDRTQHRSSRHHRPDASPNHQDKSRGRKRRSRDGVQLSSDPSDHERHPRRERRPTDSFDPAHHDGQRREGRGYAHETDRHRSSKERRRRKEPSCPAPDDRFEKAARNKTREDRYDTHRKADKKRRHSAKQKGDSSSMGHRSPKRMSQFQHPTNIMASFKSDAILSENITLKPPGPDRLGTYKSSRRPVADLEFPDMDFLKTNPEVPRKNSLSASRARRKRREDRMDEEVSAFFRAPQPDRRGNRIGTTAPASITMLSSPSRESPSLSRSESLRRLELLRQESEKPPPKSSTPLGVLKQHLGQSQAERGPLSRSGSRTAPGPDVYHDRRDAACCTTHQGPPKEAEQAGGYRDQGVMVDQSSKAKSPPPLQSSLPARAAGNNLDDEAPLQAVSQETVRQSMPVEQQHQEPPARPMSPKLKFNLAEKLQKRVDGPEFSQPVGADKHGGYGEASIRAGLRGYPPPMTQTSEQQAYQSSLSQVHEHVYHHLAAEPEFLRPRPPRIPVPLQAPRQFFSGIDTGLYGSRASEPSQFESTPRPSSSLDAPRVNNPADLRNLDDESLSWRSQLRAPAPAQRGDKYKAMAKFISDSEKEVYSKDASDYGLEPAAYDGSVQTDKYRPREVEGAENEEPRPSDRVLRREGIGKPRGLPPGLSLPADFWTTNTFTREPS